MEWRSEGEIEWLQAKLPGATAAFPTRSAGSLKADPAPLARALGLEPAQIATARQVHGAELVHHNGAPSASREADGHVLTAPGVAGLVFTADCLPVALAGPRGAAILHCGWRGLAAGILARGVEAVGATDAAIGPGIGPCCYEVGNEVPAQLTPPTGQKVALTATFRPVGPAGGMLDLAEVARGQLVDAGVERVEVAGLCTRCEAGRFFSHRREAEGAGRQGGLVWLDPVEA